MHNYTFFSTTAHFKRMNVKPLFVVNRHGYEMINRMLLHCLILSVPKTNAKKGLYALGKEFQCHTMHTAIITRTERKAGCLSKILPKSPNAQIY